MLGHSASNAKGRLWNRMMQSFDTITFAGQHVVIGKFRCPAHDPRFCDTGPIQRHLIVFPRSTVAITHAGGDPVVADPNVVMFYNKNQEYRRDRISAEGDRCDWFAYDPGVVRDIAARFDRAVDQCAEAERPFRWTHGFARAEVYLMQHALARYAEDVHHCDSWVVEENALALLDHVITDAYRIRGEHPRSPSRRTRNVHAQHVADAQALLGADYAEKITLRQIAEQLGVSSFHLCRLFRQRTGMSMHSYLTQIRLRVALDKLARGAVDLTRLALETGFSSHSHFSHLFHRSLGTTPSALRGRLTRKRLQQISKNLIADGGDPRRIFY